jgi:aminomethyltransferase
MYMPTAYTTAEDEYEKLMSGVTLWDVACERQVAITGPDAGRFVQYLTPRNLSTCKTGQCRYVVLTDADGGIVNDAVLSRIAEDEYWISPGDGDVLLWAQGVAVGCDMNVTVFEPDASPLQLQGPKSPEVAGKLFGPMALELAYYHLVKTSLNGIPLVLSRTGWSGELGYEIYLCDGARGDELWETVMAAGEEFGIAPAAPSTIRSIEGGILSYCSDITRDDNPFVLGMDRLVDPDMEADFIGKAALCRIRQDGVKRRLVGFVAALEEPIPGNSEFWPVSRDGNAVGHVTRATWSPQLEKYIGFANVPAEWSEPGSGFRVDSEYGRFDITIVTTPFVAAKKTISRD